MKRYSFSHKAMSVLICFALVFSFASAFSVHTSAAGGSYTWRIKVNVGDNFDSTSDDDSKRSYLTLKGGENNGTDAAIVIVDQKKIVKDMITDYDDGTDVYLTNVLSGGDINATTSVVSYTTTWFPTYFYMNMYKTGHGGFGNAKWTVYLEVKNASGGWTTLCSDSASKTGGWGDMYNTGTTPSNLMPKESSLRFTKTPATTLTVPRFNEAAATTEYEAKIYDQYGVLWYQEPSYSFTNYRTGVTTSNKTVYVSSEANSADGSDSSVELNAQYNLLKASATIKLINATYSYQFNDESGNKISSGNLKYGQSIPKPDNPQKAYDSTNHYIFKNWDPDMTRITGDVTFSPVFKTEQHTLLTYVSDNNATCTQDGTKTSTCSCGFKKTVLDVGSALGHSYTSLVTKQPTCTEEGVMSFSCIRGDHTYTTPIAPTGHNYQSVIVPSTCEEQGYTEHTCLACSDSYKDSYTDALGHSWNDGAITTEPTCTAEGETTYVCTRCQQSRTEAIEALGHSFKSWTIRSYPTCTENGEKFSKCTRCHETITESIAAYGHSWSEWDVNVEPKCEEPGSYSRYCLICADEEFEPIDSLGHDMQEKTLAPEDGKDGMIYYECSRQGCGKCATCVINAQGERTIGDYCTPEELEAETVDIPTAAFNTYNSIDYGYNYVNRGGSLRIDKDAPLDTQALRFSASMLIPKGAEIVDFGYVYTREDYFKDMKRFVIGGTNVFDISVKDGKYTKHTTEQGEVRTFNVVLNISKENWGYEYMARPYIIYHFAGEDFTVYDGLYAGRSVDFIAEKIMLSPLERQEVKDYIQAKIIDR
ncbi:MAG: hypothetical protein IJJ41_00680 [Clostridia bacterium]|nr:hypothetical protein [Clostridia bacterium]